MASKPPFLTFSEWWNDNGMVISAEYHAAKQIWEEAQRNALERAAMVCDQWAKQNHVYVNGAIRCSKDIRAMKENK